MSILSDDGSSSQESPRFEPSSECTSDSEGRETALWKGLSGPDADTGNSCPSLTRGSFLGFERASERQRRVQARLLTVSLTLEVAAIVAAGSNPEWIPQCSQR